MINRVCICDGCFFVNKQKSSSNNKDTVYLKFQITQHLR